MPYLDKVVPLKDHRCGNCLYWDKCKEIIAPFKVTNTKREETDPACINFFPVVINGEEIPFIKYGEGIE